MTRRPMTAATEIEATPDVYVAEEVTDDSPPPWEWIDERQATCTPHGDDARGVT